MTVPTEPTAPSRLAPLEIAPETFVLHAAHGGPDSPFSVPMNSLLIRGREPVVVDTGCPADRQTYLQDLFALVEPEDVRWVFVSHDDIDHYGNLEAVMAACPNATLVANWFLAARLAEDDRFRVPPTRWRWVGDGESFDAGDRTLVAVRPPLYDSPTTRGLFDPTTGAYWASDCYGAPVLEPTADAAELEPDFYAEGFVTFHGWNSPWVSLLDRDAFGRDCDRMERLGIQAIASAHGPSIGGRDLGRAHELLRGMPGAKVTPQPGQPVLDQIIAAMTPVPA